MADKPAKREHTTVEYVSKPNWASRELNSPESFDIMSVTLTRRTGVYPVNAAGSVQWSLGVVDEEQLITIPTNEVADAVRALLNDLGWVASGAARREST